MRSYEEALKPIRKSHQVKNILDAPWGIGASIVYDIPADIIPLLIEYRRDISNINGRDISDSRLTIRKARWMSRLYQVAKPLLEKEYPDSPVKQRILLSTLADEYSRRERLAEISGEKMPDTHYLDTLVFVRDDLSVDDAILHSIVGEFTPNESQNFKQLVNGLAKLILKEGKK